MLGPRKELNASIYYHFDLEGHIPEEHLLRRINNLMDWSFARDTVAHCYGNNGNASVDPIVVLKMLLLLILYDVKSQRELLRQLPLRLDWLWFCNYDINETSQLPDHSVLSKARRLWGRELFGELFKQVLDRCVEAGLVQGRETYIDSSTNAANAAMDSLVTHLRLSGTELYDQLETQDPLPAAGPAAGDVPAPVPAQAEDAPAPMRDIPAAPLTEQPVPAEQATLTKSIALTEQVAAPKPGSRISRTDPDARLSRKNGKTTLGYKDHRAIDPRRGIITATLTTAADVDDASMLTAVLDQHEQALERNDRTQLLCVAVADAAYGTAKNYQDLHQRQVHCCIPHKSVRQDPDKFPRERFIYDPVADTYTCPAGQTLTRRSDSASGGRRYHTGAQVRQACPLREQCTSATRHGRKLRRHPLQHEIDRADATFSPEHRQRLLTRRRTVAEGSFADAANCHGYKRHRWRTLVGANIQNLLVATAQNLRKLVAFAMRLFIGPHSPRQGILSLRGRRFRRTRPRRAFSTRRAWRKTAVR